MSESSSEVIIMRATDRAKDIPALIEKFNLQTYSGKNVVIKANFNSADPFPASTHIDTLRAVVKALKRSASNSITLAERSGMGDTRKVLEEMGVFALSRELSFDAVVLNEIGKDEWTKFERDETHWLRGFYLPNVFLNADKIVQTCCLKTHRFGGHFTLSLKNSVGMVAKRVPGNIYDYMWELHTSPFQRKMIAEINSYYKPDFVLMDGIKGFITGGPEKGKLVEPNLLLASQDRVALDAVGVAVLRLYGAKGRITEGDIFDQDQLRRASELGFGAKSSADIVLKPLDEKSREDAEKIEQVLKAQVALH